jgi:uncharacterized membrane protein
MQLTPVIAIHLGAALAALAIGPIALWARRGGQPRPALHRAAGYAWVALMLVVALTAVFIRDFRLPNISGYIHLLVPVTLGSIALAFWHLRHGRVRSHRLTMVTLYISACIVTGALTLLPSRYLGQLVWGQWLGLV